MNRKGIYTGIVGILALVLVSAALISSLAPADDGKISVQSKAVQQLNLKMLNEYHLFDKAVVEGAFDSFSGCSWNGNTAVTKIVQYVTAADNPNSNVRECRISGAIVQQSSSSNAQISLPVTCSVRNESGATLASITKNFRFNVRGEAPGSPSCTPQIVDLFANNAVVYP